MSDQATRSKPLEYVCDNCLYSVTRLDTDPTPRCPRCSIKLTPDDVSIPRPRDQYSSTRSNTPAQIDAKIAAAIGALRAEVCMHCITPKMLAERAGCSETAVRSRWAVICAGDDRLSDAPMRSLAALNPTRLHDRPVARRGAARH